MHPLEFNPDERALFLAFPALKLKERARERERVLFLAFQLTHSLWSGNLYGAIKASLNISQEHDPSALCQNFLKIFQDQNCLISYILIIVNSTLLFSFLVSSFRLLAIGFELPYPLPVSLFAAIPLPIR